MKETINIEVMKDSCYVCEDYAALHATNPPKIAIISCEGACTRGEVSRLAANMIAHTLSPDNTVRICLGAAFTKDAGQRELVRRADKVIVIEGCFINCASRMMEGVISTLKPIVIDASKIYSVDLPFGINEVTEQQLKDYTKAVAEKIAKDYIDSKDAAL
jgi:uncharacterized metal-binding protein